MILVHYTTDLCKLEKIAILVILPPARVGKQLVPYRDLIGHHVPAVGFVQHWYWIQLLKPIVLYSFLEKVLKIRFQRTFYVPPLLKSHGRILIKVWGFFQKVNNCLHYRGLGVGLVEDGHASREFKRKLLPNEHYLQWCQKIKWPP